MSKEREKRNRSYCTESGLKYALVCSGVWFKPTLRPNWLSFVGVLLVPVQTYDLSNVSDGKLFHLSVWGPIVSTRMTDLKHHQTVFTIQTLEFSLYTVCSRTKNMSITVIGWRKIVLPYDRRGLVVILIRSLSTLWLLRLHGACIYRHFFR